MPESNLTMRHRLCLCLAVILPYAPSVGAADASTEAVVSYDQVRPVFRKHCTTCHNAERPRGELDLSSIDAIAAGSGSGQVAIANKSGDSLIYTMAAHLEEPFMPPNSPKIPQRELDLIRRWIDGGLKERSAAADKPIVEAATKPAGASKPSPLKSGVAPLRRKAAVTALAVSPTAPVVALSGRRQVVLFSLHDRTPQRVIPFPEGDAFVAKFSRDGALLLIGGGEGGASGVVVGVEVATGQRAFKLGDETDAVLAADLSPDKRLVALGGPGRAVKLFQTADGNLVATLRKHTDWIHAVAFSPEGLLLASSDRFGAVMVWETETGKEFFNLRGHVGAVPALAWGADGERLVSAGQDGTLRLWSLHRGQQLSQWLTHGTGIASLSIASPNLILTGGRDRTFTVWDDEAHKLWEHRMSDEVTRIDATPDGKTAVVADASGEVVVISLTDRIVRGALELPIDASLARKAVPMPRTVTRQGTAQPSAGRIDLPVDRQADGDISAMRQALAAAEASVKAAETSLSEARAAVEQLKKLLTTREAAGKEAAGKK